MKFFLIGEILEEEEREELVDFLRKNEDVFAWSPHELLRIDPSITYYESRIKSDFKLVKQKLRGFGPEQAKFIKQEGEKLLKASFIQAEKSPVCVKIPNEEWIVCIDFTELNKVSPKNYFPLPNIDEVIDFIIRFKRMTGSVSKMQEKS